MYLLSSMTNKFWSGLEGLSKISKYCLFNIMSETVSNEIFL